MKSEVNFPFYAKAAYIFIGLSTFIVILSISQKIIVPLIYATIIAILLSPAVDFLVKRRINRSIAIVITLLVLIFSGTLIILLISNQLMTFTNSFPQLTLKFHQTLNEFTTWVSGYFNISHHKINLWIIEKNGEILKEASSLIGQTIINTGSVLIILFLIPVYIFMLLFYQLQLLEFIHKLFKSTEQSQVSEIISTTKKIIQNYLVGLLLEALIVAALNCTGLLILGIDYAILLGIIGAILNVIPYIGGIVAVALPMLVAFVTKSPTTAMLVLALYILIQFIDNHFIMPKIVGSKVQLNALISIIAVLVGGTLWGIPGMFLSIPLTAILKVICDHIDGLKPWGYLLGKTIPVKSTPFFFKRKK